MQGITFGPPYFETELGRIEPESEVHFGLLLFVSAGDPAGGVPRDELAETLWPDSQLELGRHSLRQAMYRLRQLGVPIHLRGGQVILEEDDTEIDLRDLTHGPVSRDDLLRIATQPFLPGYSTRLGARFAAWVQDLRDRTDRVRRRALVDAVREARAQARFRDIHRLARALLALDPLNETATLALAEALVMDGSKVEALQMLDEYEREVGSVSEALRVPVRTLRRRVSECLDDALLPRKFEVPFVGREAEFRELREAFVGARQGAGQCVVITGEPGIGKTRIASELLRLAVLDGAMAVTYSCTSGDALTPLSSLLTLTQSLLGQPGALGCASEHLTYLRRLYAPEPNQASIAGGMAADIAYAQLVYSLAELTAAITDEGPLVVFVDDAHRLHQTSWRIFTDVVDRLPEERVLLVFAARQLPEWYATLGINGSDGRSRHVRLLPFGAKESLTFLGSWADKNGVLLSDSTVSSFSEAAQGNPFYLSELAGHVGRGGTVGQAPASIRGLVELQYAGMSKTAQRLLITVGLLQAHASMERVASILDVAPMEFVTALDELELAGLVAAAGPVIRVRHDLVIDIVFGLVSAGVLSFLRSRVAHSLEIEAGATHSGELLSDAMTHWELCQLRDRAYACGMRIGNELLGVGMANEAATAFNDALRHAETDREAATAHAGHLRALHASLRATDLLEAATARAGLEPFLTDSSRRLVTLLRSEAELWTLSQAPSLAVLRSLLSDVTSPVEDRLRAALLALIVADNSLQAKDFLKRDGATLMALLKAAGNSGATSQVLQVVAAVCDHRKDAKERATEYLRTANNLPLGERVRALRIGGNALARIGSLREAKAALHQSLQHATSLGLPHHAVSCLDHLIRIELQLGALDTVAALIADMRPQVNKAGWGLGFLHNAEVAYAWLTRDTQAAIRLRGAVEDVDPAHLPAVNLEALDRKVALSFALPDLFDEATANSFLNQPAEARNRGCLDIWIAAGAEALVRVNRSNDAIRVLELYWRGLRPETDGASEMLLQRLSPLLVDHVTRLQRERGKTT